MQDTLQVDASTANPANPTDWNLVQSLYLQGKTPKEIEAQLGVKAGNVSVRANRYGWTKALSQSKSIVKVDNEVAVAKEEEAQLGRQSEAVKTALAADLARLSTMIEAEAPSSLKAGLKRQAEMEPMVRNAKTVFNWQDGESSASIRIGVLNQLHVSADSTAKESNSLLAKPVVEVDAQPLLTPGPS